MGKPFSYERMERLFKYRTLTPSVKRKLRERRAKLEKEIDRINVLLQKPTAKDERQVNVYSHIQT